MCRSHCAAGSGRRRSGDYSYSVASNYANRPVNYVSYWDSCRFANWLGNGQKSGAQDAATTENGANAGYWRFPTNGDGIATGMANVFTKSITNVGSFAFPSAYGTFDQLGNVWELNETIMCIGQDYTQRGMRGSAFDTTNSNFLAAMCRGNTYSMTESYNIGFRVVQAVPEPSSIIALLGGLAGLLSMRRRKV